MAVGVAARQEGHNTSRPAFSIESCSLASLKRRQPTLNADGIPLTPCGRKDLKRDNPCAALVAPVPLAKNATRRARLHSSRHQALLEEVRPGARIAEVGTQQGDFARFMIRSLKPTELRTIDIDPKMFRRCLSETMAVGQEVGTNVTCVVGESRWKIKRLQKG
eukprot:3727831-Prymnesium_polylepis.1